MSRVRYYRDAGPFVLNADGKRDQCDVSGPFSRLGDLSRQGSPADPARLFASQTSGWFGQVIQRLTTAATWAPVGNQFDCATEPGTHQWYDGTPHPWEFARVWHLSPRP
jgi:hypothetical protein